MAWGDEMAGVPDIRKLSPQRVQSSNNQVTTKPKWETNSIGTFAAFRRYAEVTGSLSLGQTAA
jgi:hypothetical protein